MEIINTQNGNDINLPYVSRIEVIGAGGRISTTYCEPGAYLMLQDAGRTLKIFVGEESSPEEVFKNSSLF